MSPQSRNEDPFPWETAEDAAQHAAAAVPPEIEQDLDVEEELEHVLSGIRDDDRADDRTGDSRAAGRAGPRSRRKPAVATREYYSISEVCEIVGLKPHVLRYWETQFPPLSPSKNRSGNRVYQRKEIKLIMLVKKLLYQEKYTVEGARAKLDQLRRAGQMKETTGRALRADVVEMLRTELESLHQILRTDARG